MGLKDDIAILGRTPVVKLFGVDALRILAFSAETRRVRAGDVLFRRGERSDGGYVVMNGTVAVGHDGADGESAVLMGPGSLIGRVALFVRMQRGATAVAREDATVMRISPTLVRRVLEEFPEAADAIRDVMAADLARFMGGVADADAAFRELGQTPHSSSVAVTGT